MPLWNNDEVTFFHITSSQGQDVKTELATYLRNQNASLNNGHSFTPTNDNCGCAVLETDADGHIVDLHKATPTFIQTNPVFAQQLADNNLTAPPVSNENLGQEDEEAGWAEFERDNERSQTRLETFAAIELWAPEGGFEPNNPPPPCTEGTMFTLSFIYDYYVGNGPSDEAVVTIMSPSTLPCANKFLIGGYVVQFTTSQLAHIENYNFDGASLNSIQFDNTEHDTYDRAVHYDVIETKIEFDSYSSYCPDDYVEYKYKLLNKRGSFQFICLPKIADLSGVILHNETGTNRQFYKGVPDDAPGYVFTIPASDITPAVAGNQVVGKVKLANGSHVYYCLTLTIEDIKRGLKETRDEQYLPPSIRLHLQHPVNVWDWARDFLKTIAYPLSPCTVDYANDRLDELHQKPDYMNEPDEDKKATMEFKSLAYDLIFGVLYCATNEEAAKGKSCVEQVALGVMHEAIASIDLAQMRDGIIQMIKGLGSTVQQNVKNMLDGVKDVIVQNTTPGPVDYEQIARDFGEKNVTGLNSLFQDALDIADNFKKMYFTECGQYVFADNTTGDICCYRGGEIAMMVVPIILTAGDYAVVKLSGKLTAKFGSMAELAAKLLNDAKKFGAKVVDDGGKLLIKESDETGTLIITTEEKVGNNIVVTGEQDLATILDEGDLNDVILTNPETNNIIQAAPGNKTTGWNKELNKPKSSKIYEVGNHKYTTNADGNVTKGTCDNLQVNPRVGNKYQQTYRSKKIKDGITGDDGGHLIGKQFGGAGEQINLVPMKSTINQNPGSWYQMEQEWRNALNGSGTVTNIEINITYGANKRPVSFSVTADVNGTPTQWNHTN